MNALTTMRLVRAAGGETRHVPTPYIPPARGTKAKKRHVPDPMKTNGNQAADELRVLLERVERVDEEISGLQDDRKDIFAEAKGRGWSDKAMREILKIRKQKKEEFQENAALLETYMISLGML
jgi:uncharacterized protein (UPF0335 family)